MKIITAQELKIRLDKKDSLLIDVREPIEHRNEYIEGTYLIPLGEIALEKLPSTKKTIVLYCKSGNRSSEAYKKLLTQDPKLDVYVLEGGITAWKQAGFYIKTLIQNILPLDQQTQIAAGVLTLSGVIIGKFIHQIFYIIPGFIGLGLIFAGLTGWCGMAKLLAKMPWNK